MWARKDFYCSRTTVSHGRVNVALPLTKFQPYCSSKDSRKTTVFLQINQSIKFSLLTIGWHYEARLEWVEGIPRERSWGVNSPPPPHPTHPGAPLLFAKVPQFQSSAHKMKEQKWKNFKNPVKWTRGQLHSIPHGLGSVTIKGIEMSFIGFQASQWAVLTMFQLKSPKLLQSALRSAVPWHSIYLQFETIFSSCDTRHIFLANTWSWLIYVRNEVTKSGSQLLWACLSESDLEKAIKVRMMELTLLHKVWRQKMRCVTKIKGCTK